MAVQYAPLFSLETQFQAKNGSNNTAGFLRVYLAATDDLAETYSDYYGTRNPDKIILDDNGRAVVICDKAKAYRLEVYDADGMLLWTEEPVYCSGNGGGGVSVTTVESTDGSIAVESSVVGSNRIYDLSIAPDNAKELLEWVKTDNEAVSDGPVRPAYVEGTMDVYSGQGIEVSDTGLYHVTVNLDVTPSGNGINYETLSVFLMLDDGSDTPVTLCQHDFDVDNSLSDEVELEFAYDLTGKGDGKLYLVVSGATPFQNVDVSLQMHRIYSGIAAVPGFIAPKVWVEQNISSKIDYSALEYNQQNLITGISGSAIAANSVDPNVFIPWSASGTFQPSGEYLSASESSNYYPMTGNPSGFIRDEECQSSYVAISSFSAYSADVESSITSIENNITSISSDVSGKVDKTAMSAWIPYSALDYSGTAISGIGGSSLAGMGGGGADYSGVAPVNVDNDTRLISVDHRTLCVDSTMTAYNSGSSAVIGVNVAGLDLSSKMDASASSLFYPSSNPSGFIDAASASAIASAYQVVSSVGTSKDGSKSIVTGINGLFISARYADTANEARKDGSGRTISSLPDSAAVSAIASSYAESAASSKQDTLTFGYNAADQISSIDGSSLAGGNSTTYGYDSADAISSIDGSAISDARQGVDLFVQYPLFTGTSGTSAYLGYNGYNESTALLWSGAAVYTSTVTLHDYWTAYEILRLYGSGTESNVHQAAFNEIPVPSGITQLNASVNSVGPWYGAGTLTLCNGQNLSFLDGNKMSAGSAFFFGMQANQSYINCTYRVNGQDVHLYKVVGVNRTAGE